MQFDLAGLDQFREVVYAISQLCLLVAILTVVLVEGLKTALKPRFHRTALGRWIDTLERNFRIDLDLQAEVTASFNEALDKAPFEGTPALQSIAQGKARGRDIGAMFYFEPYVYRLPRQLFMKRIEQVAERVLASPSNAPKSLFALAFQTTVGDRESVVAEAHQSSNPHQRDLTAWNRVSAAVSANLDDLQMEITQRWHDLARLYAIVSGVILTSVIWFFTAGADTVFTSETGINYGLALYSLVVFPALVGMVSGFAATILYDLLTRLTRPSGDLY